MKVQMKLQHMDSIFFGQIRSGISGLYGSFIFIFCGTTKPFWVIVVLI
jgi:hypothetical protein